MSNYLIWSNEHKSWWGANHRDYTNNIDFAGRYSEEEALKICNGANYGWNEDTLPMELPVLESIARKLEFHKRIYV